MFNIGNFLKKFWFNIILLLIIIAMSASMLDIYYQFDSIKAENKKIIEKVDLLKDAFKDNLTRIGKNNRYTGKNYFAIKSLLEESLADKIDQYKFNKTNECVEIKNKLNKIKLAFDELNFFDQKLDLFFETIRSIKKLNEKNPESQENLNHIESCFVEIKK